MSTAQHGPAARDGLTSSGTARDSGVPFTWSSWIVLLAWMASRAVMFFFLAPDAELAAYFADARHVLAAPTTPAPLLRVYAPGVFPLILIPACVATTLTSYAMAFAIEMLAFDALATMLLVRTGARARPGGVAGATLPALAYLLVTSLLGTLVLERWDVAVAAIILLFIESVARRRHPVRSDLWLVLATSLSLLPVLFVPFYLLYRFRTTCETSKVPTFGALARWCVRGEGLHRIIAIAAGCALTTAMAWAALPHVVARALTLDWVRDIRPESLYATALLWLSKVGALQADVESFLGAPELIGPLVTTYVAFMPAVTALAVAGGIGLLMRAAIRSRGPQPAADRDIRDGQTRETSEAWWFIQCCTAATLLAMVASPALGSTHMVWLAPLAAAMTVSPRQQTRDLFGVVAIAAVLTAFLWIGYHDELQAKSLFALSLLFARNAALLWTLVAAIGAIANREDPAATPSPWHQRASWGVLALVVLWAGTAALSTVTANDVWLQMRIGMDVLHSHAAPRVDDYSAVVRGVTFIAHEWLAGVLFYVAALPVDGAALSLMNSLVALLIAACLLRSLPRRIALTSPIVAGALFLCMYLVLYRMVLRPHIFTLLFQAVLVMRLERWRVDGRVKPLLWLIPMQVLWVNLHGGYLFSVGLLAIYAAVAAVLTLVPRLQGPELRRIGIADVRVLAGVAIACALASLINPYGPDIFGLSGDIFFRGDYMRRVIYEWGSVLDGVDFVGMREGNRPYFAMAWVVVIVALWTLLLIRNTRASLFDWVQAALATALALDARRFLADFGVLAFPIVVRLTVDVFGAGLARPLPRVPRAVVVGLVVLVASTAHDGFAFTSRTHAVTGVGFGGEQPYEEVDELSRIGARGVILNDFSSGALIIYRLYPALRPVIDARIDLYSPEVLAEYGRAIVDPEAFEAYAAKYGISSVLLLRGPEQRAIVAWLEQQPGWTLQLVTTRRVLFVKPER